MFGFVRAGRLAAAAVAALIMFGSSSPASALDLPAVRGLTGLTEPMAVSPVPDGAAVTQPVLAPSPATVVSPPVIAAIPAPRPLSQLILAHVRPTSLDAELECLATAVFFEARSEPIEGQLAVAEVVLNRAASGRYPPSVCGVVLQPAQFSFVRRGRHPTVDKESQGWRTAVAIADIARQRLAAQVVPNVLWYHATYVSPDWGRRLRRVVQIGSHIFYG